MKICHTFKYFFAWKKIEAGLRITQSKSVTPVKIQTLIWKNTVVEKRQPREQLPSIYTHV